jgi:hypothetical protein
VTVIGSAKTDKSVIAFHFNTILVSKECFQCESSEGNISLCYLIFHPLDNRTQPFYIFFSYVISFQLLLILLVALLFFALFLAGQKPSNKRWKLRVQTDLTLKTLHFTTQWIYVSQFYYTYINYFPK